MIVFSFLSPPAIKGVFGITQTNFIPLFSVLRVRYFWFKDLYLDLKEGVKKLIKLALLNIKYLTIYGHGGIDRDRWGGG
jgi:hypothetical protein